MTGIILEGNSVLLSYAFVKSLNNYRFPLSGVITVTDSRASCLDDKQPSLTPCSTTVSFSLNVGIYETYCPPDLLLFSTSLTTKALWSTPSVRMRDLKSISLTSETPSGSFLPFGTTQIEYGLQSQDESQSVSTMIGCTFNVSKNTPLLPSCTIV